MPRGVDGERLGVELGEGTELGAVEGEMDGPIEVSGRLAVDASPPGGVARSWATAATAPRTTEPAVANVVPRCLPHHDIAARERPATQAPPQRITASLLLARSTRSQTIAKPPKPRPAAVPDKRMACCRLSDEAGVDIVTPARAACDIERSAGA